MRSCSSSVLTALLALSAIATSASADTFYWGALKANEADTVYSGNAATAANWFTDAAGTSAALAAPNASDADLIFNTTNKNTVGGDLTVNAGLSARSLTFNTTGATRLVQSGSQTLNLGSGGITLGATSGNVTIGTGNFLNTRVTTSQTWTNNSAGTLTVRSLSTNADTGAATLTLNAAGAGGINFAQNTSDNSEANPLAIVIDSAGSGTVIMNGTANTYRGGTTIKRGALSAFGTLGAGSILLGDTTGSSAATLNVRSAPANPFTNNITVRGGSSGAKTLTTNQTGGVVLNGALTLDDSLTVTTFTDGTFNGGISGVGGIVKGGNAALTFAGANTSSGDLTINSGAFTLAQAGSLTFHIDANGEANQVNGSTLGAITFNGTFNLDLSEAALGGSDSWILVSFAATAIYGENFSITGFSQSDNIWTNSSGFSFAESTGVLTYSAVPEPSSFALLAGFGTLALAFGQRRKLRTPAGA